MSERKLELYFKGKVRACNAWCIKLGGIGLAGFPDRTVMFAPGRILFAELKNPNGKGKLTALQEWCIGKLRALRFEVWYIDSYELVDLFIERIKELQRENL